MKKLTPMMQQYWDIKEENPEYILLFRLGDFYEMFFEDAKLASRELDLVLTGRDCGQEERAPMCGVPHHSVDGYIARLVQKGYKVAICEQTEDPAQAKGLVCREVVRIVTPGTVTDDQMLEGGRNNYLAALFAAGDRVAFAFADVSTGELSVIGFEGEHAFSHAKAELARYVPAELLVAMAGEPRPELTEFAQKMLGSLVTPVSGNAETLDNVAITRYGMPAFERLGLGQQQQVRCCVGLVLRYLAETQRGSTIHLGDIQVLAQARLLGLDVATRRNLELTSTLRGQSKRGSLLWVLDRTKTAMGGRLLRGWLEQPLADLPRIEARHQAVEALFLARGTREDLQQTLRGAVDLQRLLTKVVYASVNARELRAMKETLRLLPSVCGLVAVLQAPRLQALAAALQGQETLCEELDAALSEEDLPVSVKEGGLIRVGYNTEVDRLRDLVGGSRRTLAEIEAAERTKTGIKNLKIAYNRVFGYYLEVTKSAYHLVPDRYIRKQTLANCERFVTPELKKLEAELLLAGERLSALEYQLFTELRQIVAQCATGIAQAAEALAEVDALCSLAEVAAAYGYCRPDMHGGDTLLIKEGRHPVVERMLEGTRFVPNDIGMDCGDNRMVILTGPNMAGKSTYMRQVALIVLMAQMGSFVPAQSASIGLVDQIYTRVGAADDLASGQSTFLVEMRETAGILAGATKRSLLVFDEIGRGTSTFDGMSIARAVVEYLADPESLGARTLFATHYHELTELEQTVPGVTNYCIAVKKRGDDIIFLRRILRGGADDSYGIEVAQLAGLPAPVIRSAKQVLQELERSRGLSPSSPTAAAAPPTPPAARQALDQLNDLELSVLTPLEALNKLYELQQLVRGQDGNAAN